MAEPRLRRAGSVGEIETVVDDYMTQGYEILSRGEYSVMMRKKTWGGCLGHVLVALFTLWWTFGVGNLIYAVIVRYTAETVLVKYTPPVTSGAPAPQDNSENIL